MRYLRSPSVTATASAAICYRFSSPFHSQPILLSLPPGPPHNARAHARIASRSNLLPSTAALIGLVIRGACTAGRACSQPAERGTLSPTQRAGWTGAPTNQPPANLLSCAWVLMEDSSCLSVFFFFYGLLETIRSDGIDWPLRTLRQLETQACVSVASHRACWLPRSFASLHLLHARSLALALLTSK